MLAPIWLLSAMVVAAVVVAQRIPEHKVDVDAAGRVYKSTDVVRRVAKRTTGQNIFRDSEDHHQRSSTFIGMARTDRYTLYRGLKCDSAHGGSDIDSDSTAPLNYTLEQCKELCRTDDECTCVNHDATTGRCARQRFCHLDRCEASLISDVHKQHSAFTVNTSALSQFYRNGGRECTAEQDNATMLDVTLPPMSVTKCLTTCTKTPGCTCTRYERYYVSACTLMANCSNVDGTGISFCERSNKYDMYIMPTNKTSMSLATGTSMSGGVPATTSALGGGLFDMLSRMLNSPRMPGMPNMSGLAGVPRLGGKMGRHTTSLGMPDLRGYAGMHGLSDAMGRDTKSTRNLSGNTEAQLHSLEDLRDAGALTEEMYEQARQRVLEAAAPK